eukprot:COSAG06_NODE_7032_length_2665_cov_2.584178_4_plen_32_part_01
MAEMTLETCLENSCETALCATSPACKPDLDYC